MRRAQPWRTNRARVLRSESSSAEDRLWSRLRNRNFAGLKFTRQAPILLVDFLCRDRKIIVEVDGGTHVTGAEISQDERRATELRQLGYGILRASDIDVYENIDGVLDTLLAFIENKSS
jgi:very-short-patch-repair endonuclease